MVRLKYLNSLMMFKNIKVYKLYPGQLISILFNIFPLIMLMPSGYITFYIVFLIIYSYTFIFIKKIKIKIFFIDYLIFIFFILSIISTIINQNNPTNYIILSKSIADIRFALLFLLIRNLFYYKIIRVNIFLIFSLVCAIFLSLDIFLQFFYGKDILGYPEINSRYSGVFGDEAIAGGYIQKFSILAILCCFFLKFSKLINKKLFIVFVATILAIGILLTLDRIPFIIYFSSLFLLLILFKNNRKQIFLSILLIIFFFLVIYKNNDLVKRRYSPIYHIIKIAIIQTTDVSHNKQNEQLEVLTMNSGIEYFKIFNSAIYVFKNQFWLGSGTKSYLKSCIKLIKYNKNLLCAPHPHNIYLEILINQGIVGMIIFVTFLTLLFKKYYFDLTKMKMNKNKLLKISFMIILITELWPLRSYGSIFQTVNGSLFWFLISISSSNLLTKKI
jgi:O-antigen ligase